IDGKSVQTHIEDIVNQLNNNRLDIESIETAINDMRESLDAKANVDDVYTKNKTENLISPKADKDYVDQLVINANNNIHNFKTEVGLKAFIPTEEGYTAKALDTKKIWLWDNGVWEDTGLSELDLAKNYSDNKVENIFIKHLISFSV